MIETPQIGIIEQPNPDTRTLDVTAKSDEPKIFKTCPTCGYPVTTLSKDSEGKQLFICAKEKCRAITAEPIEIKFNDYMAEGAFNYSYEDKEGKKHFCPVFLQGNL